MKKLLFLLLIGMSLGVWGQTSKPQWVNFYSMNIVTSIVPEGNTMWVGTKGGGIYQSDLNGNMLQRFTIDNGLFSNNINSIAIDAQGNKWIGTSDGVTKFDGKIWTTYTVLNGLAHNNVTSIAIDVQGNKWFGTPSGVSKFDGVNWKTYSVPDGLASYSVNSITIDIQGNIWFGTDLGVSKFDGNNWTTFAMPNGTYQDVSSIAIDAQGNKWFELDDCLAKIDINNVFTPKNGDLASNVSSIVIDAQGNKWFGINRGVTKIDVTNNRREYSTAHGLVDNNVKAISIDSQGNKWFGTISGISKFDGNNWTNFVTNGLVQNVVNSILIDDKGNKWFGTAGGVSKFDGTNWTTYTTTNGLANNYVTSIAIDVIGNLWFGTLGGGVSKYDGTSWTNYNKTNGLASNDVYSIAIDAQGNKWFGTYYGISKFDNINWKTYPSTNGLGYNYVTSITLDLIGNMWFGMTEKGVFKFDGITWQTYNMNDGLSSYCVSSIAIDALGNKWFGTYYGGVSKFDGTSWINYNTKNGLADKNVQSIAIDVLGKKWFGTSGGLSKFDGINWTTYTTVNGLVDNNITSIALDSKGNKWVGTYGGVSVFNENTVDLINNTLSDSFPQIKGHVFLDFDKNATFSTGDCFLKNQKVLLLPDSISSFTNYKGEYAFNVDSGKTYTIQIIPQTPYNKGSQSLSLQIKTSKNDTILSRIGLYGLDTVCFQSSFNAGIHRCGKEVPFYYTFRNTGTHIANAVVAVQIDKRATIVRTIPTVDSIGSDRRLFWKYNNLPISDDRQVQIQVNLLNATIDTLFYKAELIYKNSVATSADLVLPTRCSYDPNDKQVSPVGINKEKLTLKNQQLQYTIRFQNTGNDYAYDVKILDTLATSLNWSTLAVVASSHKVRTEITAKGIVTYYFDNIMLPDSATNYIGSNGFVCYTIQPKSIIAENTEIENTAHIIFDQNPAVVTNTTLNTLVSFFPFPVSGDSDGNGIINGTEIAGDSNKNGIIDGTEMLGDLNGDGMINNGEVLGDTNGNGIIDGFDIFKTIQIPILVGDINGNGIIDLDEIAGDVNNSGIIDGNEIEGDLNGDGKINNSELLGDRNGNGVLDGDESTRVKEILNYSISLYPNPVTDNLTIKLSEGKIPTSIRIVNSLGQTVYSNQKPMETSVSIPMNDKPSGIYFVQIVVDGKCFSKMLVKK